MWALLVVYLAASYPRLGRATDEICCCPDLGATLSCKDESSGGTQTVQNRVNGYKCDALEGSDVRLECTALHSSTSHPAVASTRFLYYKINSLDLKPLYMDDNALQISGCEADTCVLSNVTWSDATYSESKLQNYDNFNYQCMIEYTLIDGSQFNISSNSMWLDVYKNIDTSTKATPTLEEYTNLNTNKPYETLACAMPSTYPDSKATWYFRRSTSASWEEIDIPSQARFALIEEDISSESSSSAKFAVGTLVVMLFQPDEDAGYYLCNATYTTESVGENTTYSVAEYQLIGNGHVDQGSPELKMLAAITSDDYTLRNEAVNFTCYARDTDAETTGLFQWVYENSTSQNFEPVDLTLAQFAGVKLHNYNRTLELPSTYQNHGIDFRCRVERDSTTKLSDIFTQPVIVPEYLTPPASEGVCYNTDETIEIVPNKKYMMSDEVTVTDYVQKLPGASSKWFVHKVITSLYNSGGETKETVLKITNTTYVDRYTEDASKKCQYFSFLQTKDTDYQILEVIKMLRPLDSYCADVTQSVCDSAEVNVTECDSADRRLTVKLADKSRQCLEVEFTNGDVTVTKTFSQTAASCNNRELEVFLTKSEVNENLSGNFTLTIRPEGKSGCSRVVNIDTVCGAPPEETGTDPEAVFSCPLTTYKNAADRTPWTLNASKACAVGTADVVKFGITPSQGCQIGLSASGDPQPDMLSCNSEIKYSNLTDNGRYKLTWRDLIYDRGCEYQIRVECASASLAAALSSAAALLTSAISLFIL